jgi:hypothetical protein
VVVLSGMLTFAACAAPTKARAAVKWRSSIVSIERLGGCLEVYDADETEITRRRAGKCSLTVVPAQPAQHDV